MARPLRIEYPGAIYHVLSRGNRGEAIFRTEADRKLFLDLLDQTCRRTGWPCRKKSRGEVGPRAELKRRRKGDEAKVALARRLREETAVSLRWIAENLYMGTWTHVSNRLYHCR
jgi:hypothetical protein